MGHRRQLTRCAHLLGCTVLSLVAVDAAAQSSSLPPLERTSAEPLLGSSASSQQVSAPDTLQVLPTLSLIYDTNALRGTFQGQDSGDGNFRITPSVAVILNRRFGRTTVTASGSAGYDFNSRFKDLNQVRIAFNGSANLPIGGRCSVTPQVGYQRYQTDLADLEILRDNTTEFQDYTLTAACPQRVGFFPYVSVNQNTGKNSNDNREILDYRTRSATVGMNYYRPSLGTVQLLATFRRIERPNVEQVIGIEDRTSANNYGVRIERSVSPRLSAAIGLSYLTVDPNRPGVRGYDGLAYNGSVTYRPNPSWALTAFASRDARGESAISASYVLENVYRLNTSYKLSARSSIDGGLERSTRSFRGEGLFPGNLIRGGDRTNIASIRYNFDPGRVFRLSTFAAYRERDGDNDIFDYDAIVVGASVSTRL
jgi:Putative beta-barrel porin 2